MTTLFASKNEESNAPKERQLSDDLYQRLRDLHISDVGKTISSEVKEIKEVNQASLPSLNFSFINS